MLGVSFHMSDTQFILSSNLPKYVETGRCRADDAGKSVARDCPTDLVGFCTSTVSLSNIELTLHTFPSSLSYKRLEVGIPSHVEVFAKSMKKFCDDIFNQ